MGFENVKCPVCNASYFQVQYSTETALYSPPVYRDGELISKDPNWHTTFCICLNCGNTFIISSHEGEVNVMKS